MSYSQKKISALALGSMFLLLLQIGCNIEKQESYIDTIEVNAQAVDSLTVVAEPVKIDQSFRLFSTIGLTAVKKGLVITPFLTSLDKDPVAYWMNHTLDSVSQTLYPLIPAGKGPGEISIVSGIGKNSSADTIAFFSNVESKFLIFDEMLSLHSENIMFEPLKAKGSFSHENYYFTIPTSSSFNDGYSFKIVDLKNKKAFSTIKARVSLGYEPQIRNYIETLSSTTNGFVFAYTGDKEVRFLDSTHTFVRSIKFGDNDPIEIRKRKSSRDGSSSTSYITKIEFDNSLLYVLYQQRIYIFSYPDLRLVKKLKVIKNKGDIIPKVTNFSVVDDLLYVSFMETEIGRVKIKTEWLYRE